MPEEINSSTELNARSKPGFGFGTLLILFALVLAALVAIPNFMSSRTRAPVARARTDMRNIANAIDAYFADQSAFPAWSAHQDSNLFSKVGKKANFVDGILPTFALLNASGPQATLTTPIAFLSSYPSEPFAMTADTPYCYWADKSGWIIWSAGPDMKYDLTLENIAEASDHEETGPNDFLIARTYDPSNGNVSPGDIYWVKN